MTHTSRKLHVSRRALVVILGISIALTFFLAFIDEGYYSFAWMKDPGSWVAVTLYVSVFFIVQYIPLLLISSLRSIRR